MLLVLKLVISATVIAGINAVAQRNAQLAGWIAAAPLISLMSIVWLMHDGREHVEIQAFVQALILGLIPTAIYLGALVLALRHGFGVAMSLGGAIAIWTLAILAATRLGLITT